MIDSVKIAFEIYKDDLEKPCLSPLPKIQLGLHAIESILKYPGKVFSQDDLLFISDTSNHR